MGIELCIRKIHRSSEILLKIVDLNMLRDKKWRRCMSSWAWITLKQILTLYWFLLIMREDITTEKK